MRERERERSLKGLRVERKMGEKENLASSVV